MYLSNSYKKILKYMYAYLCIIEILEIFMIYIIINIFILHIYFFPYEYNF